MPERHYPIPTRQARSTEAPDSKVHETLIRAEEQQSGRIGFIVLRGRPTVTREAILERAAKKAEDESPSPELTDELVAVAVDKVRDDIRQAEVIAARAQGEF
jgi:hypothetical protein